MIDFVSTPISDTTIVVQVSGSMTETNRTYFFDCIADMIDSGAEHVIIECYKLGFINSSGLASLLTARKRAIKKGCRISLTHLNSNITDVLELTKLGRILSVYPTTEAAILATAGQPTCVG